MTIAKARQTPRSCASDDSSFTVNRAANTALKPNLDSCLVIGISSRALFDLEEDNRIFENECVAVYRRYQRQHEQQILRPGTAFHVVRELLAVNQYASEGQRLVEVVIMSRNSPDTGVRIFHSIEHYDLDITRAAFAGGEGLDAYLDAFSVDLFLSRSEEDVQAAVNAGVAAAVLCQQPEHYEPIHDQVRIAFDGDAVLFSDESERIYQEQGLNAFTSHETLHRLDPLAEGPFAKLLKTIAWIQNNLPRQANPFRLALVTARSSPAHARVLYTLRHWGVDLDEAFFLGGISKDKVLKAFRAHLFFDDQDSHLCDASKVVPAAKVPYRQSSDVPYEEENISCVPSSDV